ncbi:MAG: glycoside hydrolase family 25 protein [Clostridiales bacterium]|nr:glycoside hydrolase family 25 protein [Clostridiales bacterium]
MPKKLLSLLLALVLVIGVYVPVSVSADSNYSLSQTMMALRPGESGVLFATSSSGTATVQSWSSSNPSVATVSGGRVQGISYGISTVTAYFPDGSYASCQVHVALMGIDVSYYQGNINWTSVANSGLVDFAIIRTGYGGENWSTQKDTCFEQNYSGCVANNIPVGVYHFSYATTPEMAKKEAEFCLYILNGRKLDYPVFYDIETAAHRAMDSTTMAAIVEAFCSTIEAAGYDVALYSSPTLYNSCLSSPTLDKYDRWVAHYGVDRPNFYKDFTIWQSGFRTVPGISGNVDANYGYKDYASSGGSGGSVNPGGDDTYTLECDVSSYTFGSNNTYDFIVWTDNPRLPTVKSNSPEIVSISLSSVVTGGYKYTLTKQSEGDALITIVDDVGNMCAFIATVPANSSQTAITCDTTSYTFNGTSDSYIFQVYTTSSMAPTVSSSNTAVATVSYYAATSNGFQYKLTNKGSGSTLITIRDQNGTSVSFPVTGYSSSSGGSGGSGGSSTGTLPCDTSAYTFTTLNAYTYKVTTNSKTAPTATSSNPSAVSVAYKGTCEGGYLFTITNQGAGTATITTKDADGRTCSFVATGKGSSSGGSSTGTLPCDTSSYTFTTLNAYTYKVTTSSTTPPTATSSNTSAVTVAYKGTCEGGYLFTITNQGAGTATITTKDADGRTCSFVATGKGSSSGGSSSNYTIKSDTTAPFNMRVGASYTFKFTVTGGGSPQFASGNTNFLQLTKVVQEGNDYFVTFKAVAAGQVGVYASADGPYMDRQCIIDVI